MAVIAGIATLVLAAIIVHLALVAGKRHQGQAVSDVVGAEMLVRSATRMPDTSRSLKRLELPPANDVRHLAVSFDTNGLTIRSGVFDPAPLARIPSRMVQKVDVREFPHRFRTLHCLVFVLWNGREQIALPLQVNAPGLASVGTARRVDLEELRSDLFRLWTDSSTGG
ncbi:hypothetical protein [uncultured Leifsonia sp.]|uniref:hypothetical protein n=1 Tax=uncultured Leifsonia sp. TaxID=340359 RepID=UPI0025E3B67C|nr:hypothetical protein [uncultured Leifsonia sp.]